MAGMTDDEIAALAKTLGHPQRIGFVRALREHEGLSPSEYATALNVKVSTSPITARVSAKPV